ncbi:MAG: Holliday junction resolvase RuvX [Patescibacteria group bacterium]
MEAISSSILALDVGAKRIGIAIASSVSRLPRPYKTLENNDHFLPALKGIVESEGVDTLVVGLPRNLSGQSTDQTTYVQTFTAKLYKELPLAISFQDEALTSKKAEEELESRGKPYQRGDIDALAATYILEDFLAEHKEGVA